MSEDNTADTPVYNEENDYGFGLKTPLDGMDSKLDGMNNLLKQILDKIS
jgi:hypothetical protein